MKGKKAEAGNISLSLGVIHLCAYLIHPLTLISVLI